MVKRKQKPISLRRRKYLLMILERWISVAYVRKYNTIRKIARKVKFDSKRKVIFMLMFISNQT